MGQGVSCASTSWTVSEIGAAPDGWILQCLPISSSVILCFPWRSWRLGESTHPKTFFGSACEPDRALVSPTGLTTLLRRLRPPLCALGLRRRRAADGEIGRAHV